MVARAIPEAWSCATPTTLLEARLTAMDSALRRVLGDDVISSAAVSRAAALATAAVAGCDMAGRPLGAANQAVPAPEEPHLQLWQALTAMREYRGDGHVGRLGDAGVSPCEALVLQAAAGRSPEDGLRVNSGWPDEEWGAAAASLRARWLADVDGRMTPASSGLRQAIEDRTDRAAAPLAASIGDEAADELVALLRPLADAVMAAGAVPAQNNMGVPWPPK
jgi:hypothetical protein